MTTNGRTPAYRLWQTMVDDLVRAREALRADPSNPECIDRVRRAEECEAKALRELRDQ